MSKAQKDRSRLFVAALARGLQVLEALAREAKPLTLTEIAQAVDLNVVTVSRFCHTLTELGYLERDPTKRYQFTPKILNLGYAVLCTFDLCRIGEPYLRELSRSLKETVNMAVLEGLEILYVSRFKTEQILRTELHIGSKLPLYCTSMGKAILAHMPEDERMELVDQLSFGPLTHRTITTRDSLLAELETVRRNGFALNDEELSIGLRSIAAPVFKDGRVVAAINIAVPTVRYGRDSLVKLLSEPLTKTAARISFALSKQVAVHRVSHGRQTWDR